MRNRPKRWLRAAGIRRPTWWDSSRARGAFLGSLLPWLIAVVVFSFDWSSMGKLPANVSASPSGHGTLAEAAVDGIRYAQLGYHSAGRRGPAHLTLDLGTSRYVDRIRVFGRGDCCFSQSIPLHLSLSDDGSQFERVLSLEHPFSQYQPWVARVAGKTRFVRLSTDAGRFLVLSEVEVLEH